MTEPDLKQYAAELAEFEDSPSAAIELTPQAAIAIISHIQLATRHPSLADNAGLAKMAIEVAVQLQALFNTESATYKVLELGWNSQEEILVEKTDLDSVFEAQNDDDDDDDDDDRFDDNFYSSPTWSERMRNEGVSFEG